MYMRIVGILHETNVCVFVVKDICYKDFSINSTVRMYMSLFGGVGTTMHIYFTCLAILCLSSVTV